MAVVFAAIAPSGAFAQDATWLLSPGTRNFNAGANWSTGTAPGAGNTAFFGASNTLNPRLQNNRQIGGITLLPDAGNYVLSTNGRTLRLTGAGIVINSGALRLRNTGVLRFQNFSTAGRAQIINLPNGTLRFEDDSTAGTADIRNRDVGLIEFVNRASAGNASIRNAQAGVILFGNRATLANASLNNLGLVQFDNRSTAGTGSIVNLGLLGFGANASAGGATIVNDGNAGLGVLLFVGNSTAGNATIRTTAGGQVVFGNRADGGTAAFLTDAGSLVDFSGSDGPLNDGVVHAGSIAGAGNYFIRTLSVGGNNRSTDVSGVIQDGCGCVPFTDSLVKVGAGTLTLSGINTYTGLTQVKGGRLVVNGSIATSIATLVNDGGTLGGNGVTGAVGVLSGGTLAPGNSVGTLTVNGRLVFLAGSAYEVEVSTTADRVNVVPVAAPPLPGDATLAGTVRAVYLATGTLQKRYTVLTTAAGTTGAFDGVTSSAPGIVATLAYDGMNVYLDSSVSLSGMRGLTDNQRAVAGAIDRYFAANGSVPMQFATLDAPGLTLVSGELATGAAGAGLRDADLFLSMLGAASASSDGNDGGEPAAFAPLAYAPERRPLSSPGALAALGASVPEAADAGNALLSMTSAHAADSVEAAFASRWKAWGAVYGGVAEARGEAIVIGSSDLTTRNWGIATGIDRSFGNGRVGVALGGAGSTIALANGLGSGSAGIFNAGVYGRYDFGDAYVGAAAVYAWNNVRTTRFVGGDTLTANFNAHTFSGRIETGYRIATPVALVTPYAALQGSAYILPAYAENSALGGPFALAFARQSLGAARSELGARFEHTVPLESGALKLSARAAWAYNMATTRAITAAFQALPGQSFTVNGARPDRSAFLADIGVEASFANGVSASLSFNGEFSRNLSAYGASAKLTYRW